MHEKWKYRVIIEMSLNSIIFYFVELFLCNIQYVLLVGINYIGFLILLICDFFILLFPLIDVGFVASESEIYISSSIGLFLFMESLKS